MSWQTPIYDRTATDVALVVELNARGWDNMTPEERATFSQPMKGALNGIDVARINGNINVIRDIYSLDITEQSEVALTGDPYMVLSRFEEQHSAMRYIREHCPVHSSTPFVPADPVPNHFTAINAIERILHDVYEIWQDNQDAVRYTGEVVCRTGWIDLL